ncbi:hypothetical protein [Sorangium sp. So ce693]|uniref:hypothetical protein n=1 Tax=Sorangium sp. So ce693 TaxID=3133318 RepID=UPI003F61AB4F
MLGLQPERPARLLGKPTWSPCRCGRRSTCARSPLAAGREHTCALDEEGGVFCWGSDGQGQIGTGRQGRAPRGSSRPCQGWPAPSPRALPSPIRCGVFRWISPSVRARAAACGSSRAGCSSAGAGLPARQRVVGSVPLRGLSASAGSTDVDDRRGFDGEVRVARYTLGPPSRRSTSSPGR